MAFGEVLWLLFGAVIGVATVREYRRPSRLEFEEDLKRWLEAGELIKTRRASLQNAPG